MIVSANLIGFGCDLQQKLDAMDSKLRRARWAGDVGSDLYRIAQRLHDLDTRARSGRAKPTDARTETRLLTQARAAVVKLGLGIEVHRQPDRRGWPFVVVFPGDAPKGSGPEAVFEQGVAVPPLP